MKIILLFCTLAVLVAGSDAYAQCAQSLNPQYSGMFLFSCDDTLKTFKYAFDAVKLEHDMELRGGSGTVSVSVWLAHSIINFIKCSI